MIITSSALCVSLSCLVAFSWNNQQVSFKFISLAISACFYPGDFYEKFEKSSRCLNYWNIILSFGDITEISY